MATHTQDDGFREIQLNGKQLVFVFMAATVVSVVIFLCGVLVGRGVRGERESVAAANEQPAPEVKPDLTATERPPTVEEREDPTKASPPAPPPGDAEHGSELVKPVPPVAAKAEPAPVAPAAAVKVPSAAKPAPVALAPKAESPKAAAPPRPEGTASTPRSRTDAVPAKAPAPRSEPVRAIAGIPAVDDPKRGWVIQVAAVRTRDEAEGLAKELGEKGYAAFVLSGNSNVFRVRVGGYKSKRDAETVAAKLRKEERINPWVTR